MPYVINLLFFRAGGRAPRSKQYVSPDGSTAGRVRQAVDGAVAVDEADPLVYDAALWSTSDGERMTMDRRTRAGR